MAGANTRSYEAALARLAAIEGAEAGPELNPDCRGFALTHGGRAARCTVLLHGYTNCPRQFRSFAPLLHARGHNVYVPRLPFHGLADRLTVEQARLDRRAMLAYLDDALAVGHGLGEQVGVLGLSAGGNLAAYAAQHRGDLAQAVIIAPVFGAPAVAAWATAPLAAAAAVLPNQFRWWDPATRMARRGPAHCYPRFSTRALGAIVRLGLGVLRDARRRPPAAREVIVVSNAADPSVRLPPIEELLRRWRAHGVTVREQRFAASLGLLHDLMDPDQERQQVALVYPVLLELLGEG
jgi:pimeloyl-ACP methyl ester carboxylesterase